MGAEILPRAWAIERRRDWRRMGAAFDAWAMEAAESRRGLHERRSDHQWRERTVRRCMSAWSARAIRMRITSVAVHRCTARRHRQREQHTLAAWASRVRLVGRATAMRRRRLQGAPRRTLVSCGPPHLRPPPVGVSPGRCGVAESQSTGCCIRS